jgi:hypothetical protein
MVDLQQATEFSKFGKAQIIPHKPGDRPNNPSMEMPRGDGFWCVDQINTYKI